MTKTEYKEVNLALSENKKKKLALAERSGCSATINFKPGDTDGEDKLFLTDTQIKKMEKAFGKNKGVNITFSAAQVKHNIKHGGFLGLLGGLARAALPMVAPVAKSILKPLGLGAISELGGQAVKKLFGNGLFLKKGGTITQIETDGKGLYLKPKYGYGLSLTPNLPPQMAKYGNGVFLVQDGKVQGGDGLIFGENSPFSHIPLIGPLLGAIL